MDYKGYSGRDLEVAATPDVPNTRRDMANAAKWEHGQRLYGTDAKADVSYKNYRNDINKDWGKEKSKKSLFIDTLSRKKTVSQQMLEAKKG